MLVSIIAPVYNVEQYLSVCINSVLTQTYTNFELILVNDGSTDSSAQICDDFAKYDSRIIVVHKSNEGPSVARNIGTQYAHGDYIIYIDSDDFWADSESLTKLIEEVYKTPECDFIGFNCSYYYSKEKVIKWINYSTKLANAIHPENCIEQLVSSGVFPMSQCLKIIKTKVAKNLTFKSGTYGEDIIWFIDLLKSSHKCRFINHYMYMYRKSDGISRSSTFSMQRFQDIYNIVLDNVKYTHQNWSDNANKALLSFWSYELCILIGQLVFMKKTDREIWRNKLKEFSWLFRYTLSPKVRKVVFVKTFFGYYAAEFLLGIYMKKRKSLA